MSAHPLAGRHTQQYFWLGQNNAVVMTVLFLIFAVVLIGKGIAGI
jgi:hypothetical protein